MRFSGGSSAFTQYSTADNGVVQGVHPLWGTFQLSYMGETTVPIYFDASATEVELYNLPVAFMLALVVNVLVSLLVSLMASLDSQEPSAA